MQKEQYFWNWIALVAFAVLCGIAVFLVSRYAVTDFTAFGFFDFVILGFATFRLLHLLTYDKMFAIVRDPFMDGKGKRLRKASRGWRRLVCEFLECIWCTGMWSALLAVTVYCLGTWGFFAVLVLAVAGLGSLFQVISKAVAESDS